MHLFRHLFCILCLILPAPVFASVPGPQETLGRINHCIYQQNAAQCRDLVTNGSQPIYDRFVSYGFLECLPGDTDIISEQRVGRFRVLRVGFTSGGKNRIARLAFTQEARQWKLDIPQSLRTGMGENWENQLNMTEQIYLMIRQQMGGKLNCGSVQQLVQK